MKSCIVLARTVWLVAVGLLFGKPAFPQLTSAEIFAKATAPAGALITNAYISTDNTAKHPECAALNYVGPSVW